jgi:hypothetical protein
VPARAHLEATPLPRRRSVWSCRCRKGAPGRPGHHGDDEPEQASTSRPIEGCSSRCSSAAPGRRSSPRPRRRGCHGQALQFAELSPDARPSRPARGGGRHAEVVDELPASERRPVGDSRGAPSLAARCRCVDAGGLMPVGRCRWVDRVHVGGYAWPTPSSLLGFRVPPWSPVRFSERHESFPTPALPNGPKAAVVTPPT